MWQPRDGRWIRPAPGPFGDHFAPTRVLEPRAPEGPTRVLLVGESVAAGYLLDAPNRPGAVLADLLPAHDVVDLARTNETLESLLGTVEQASQLDPDVLVVWAGNNWVTGDLAALSPYHPAAVDRPGLGAALADGGMAAAQEWADTAVRRHVATGLDRLAALAGAAGCRVVVVVPRVNEVDWPHADPDPLWDWPAGVDGITRGHGPLRCTARSPMATPVVREVLAERAKAHGWTVVDAADALEGPADRRWFYDYCHHTTEGIAGVMTAVARTLTDGPLGRVGATAGPARARAAVGAMLHTAHRLAGPARAGLLAHWRDQALSADPSVRDTFADVVATRLTRGPAVLTTAQRRNLAGPHPLGLMHGWRPLGLDADVLVVLGAGSDPRLVPRWVAPDDWPPVGSWAVGDRVWADEAGLDGAPAHLRAVSRVVRVPWVADGSSRTVRLVARLPRPGTATIGLGEWTARVALGTEWTTVEVPAPPGAASGLVPLSLHLPDAPRDSARGSATLAAARAEVLADLAADRPADLYPAHAEIWHLGPR